MKIKTIMCNSSKEFYDAHAGRRLAMSTDEVQLVVVNIPHGPDSMESAYDEAIAAPYILQQVVSAETEGCDAVVIDCAADPALRAAREISELPVVSAGEASYHAAMMVAGKFSVITVLPTTANEISDHLKMYGFSSRIASVRSANVPVLALEDEQEAEEHLYAAARKAIDEDGAQAIVLGCTGMMAMRDSLEKRLGVPVIEPYLAAIQFAASLVRMKLRQSRLSYIKGGQKTYN
mgnify:FL=1